jgi:predicted MPP superfamily phosphohydrolase
VSEYDSLKAGLVELGVAVLENAKVTIESSGEKMTLAGVIDPSFKTDYLKGDDTVIMGGILTELLDEEDGYTILLSHRPELFEVYAQHTVDLVFSGHAHGGQFRIPFVGGLIAPNQGLFPKYDAGIYEEGSTTMVVSRGIGNSIVPFRINNRPEIVLAELASQAD